MAALSLLRIKNLALVEDLEWQLEPGFTVVTGETGAGKSIIIGALQLLLGERTDKSLIRTGTETCTIEALFSGSGLQKLNPLLTEAGIEQCDDELIVKRSFSTNGANRQFINGSPTTLTILKAVGDELVDLHGPHDHQSILSPERQLALLDGFAHVDEKVRQFELHHRELQSLRAEYDKLNTADAARTDQIHLLRHQIAEIADAKVTVSEEEEIVGRYKLAANSRRLIELASTTTLRLSDAADAVLPQLAETQRLLRELEKIDPSQATLADAHAACVIELSDIARSLEQYVERLDLDPKQFAALEARVSLIETLKRKYGGTIAEVIAFLEKAEQRLSRIEGRDDELERLRKEIEAAQTQLLQSGEELHRLRSKAAPKISESIRGNLRDLGFRQSEFEAKLTKLEEARPTGFDSIELLFSPNPGEPLKPLRTIASSGEISRVMLAIKSSLAEQDAIPLLVFDEIDANVGGEIASAVGAKMKKLAGRHQILCITHLPQVAAAATNHFVVTKQVTKGRTHSHLTRVAGAARNEEIARMLGGKSDSALQHATTLLAAGKGK